MIYLRHPAYTRWCRLSSPGTISHITACGATMPADEPVLLHPDPPVVDRCTACEPEVDAVAVWDAWFQQNGRP